MKRSLCSVHFDEVSGTNEDGLDRLPPQEADVFREFANEICLGKRFAHVEAESIFGDGTMLIHWSHDQWMRGETGLLCRTRGGSSYFSEMDLPQ